jgi:hypothetical protein
MCLTARIPPTPFCWRIGGMADIHRRTVRHQRPRTVKYLEHFNFEKV